jgi:hypothetical protein
VTSMRISRLPLTDAVRTTDSHRARVRADYIRYMLFTIAQFCLQSSSWGHPSLHSGSTGLPACPRAHSFWPKGALTSSASSACSSHRPRFTPASPPARYACRTHTRVFAP